MLEQHIQLTNDAPLDGVRNLLSGFDVKALRKLLNVTVKMTGRLAAAIMAEILGLFRSDGMI